jgi:DNA repair exonuclease SbcCD ATPase subunit
MEDIWSRIYPYNDLLSIKLDPLSYGIFLKNVKNEWVNANSEVSGGERQCAALALRIALSLLLAPQFRILILDEPTHNLDSRAIEDLADTIRNGVSGLLDQMFLITHEERLESAATGKIYRLRKKGTASGLTEVEEGVIEVS